VRGDGTGSPAPGCGRPTASPTRRARARQPVARQVAREIGVERRDQRGTRGSARQGRPTRRAALADRVDHVRGSAPARRRCGGRERASSPG
jgi:hypothetical protein